MKKILILTAFLLIACDDLRTVDIEVEYLDGTKEVIENARIKISKQGYLHGAYLACSCLEYYPYRYGVDRTTICGVKKVQSKI